MSRKVLRLATKGRNAGGRTAGRLEGSLGERRAELEKQLRQFDKDLGERILRLVAAAREGRVDYMAEFQDGLGGVYSPALEEAGHLTLHLLDEERAGRPSGSGDGGPT